MDFGFKLYFLLILTTQNVRKSLVIRGSWIAVNTNKNFRPSRKIIKQLEVVVSQVLYLLYKRGIARHFDVPYLFTNSLLVN